MKKHIIILGIGLLTLIILLSIFISKSLTVSDPYGDLPKRYASYAWGSTTSEELLKQSDIIGFGKIVDCYTMLHLDMVFTHNIVEFEKIYMVSNEFAWSEIINWSQSIDMPIKIELVQTGGIYKEHKTRPYEEEPLLNIGERYLFFLKHFTGNPFDEKSWDIYFILGGFQGVADIKNDQIHFKYIDKNPVIDFSDLNVRLSDFTVKLQEFGLSKSDYVINTNSRPIEVFIEDLMDNMRQELLL